MSKLVCDTDSAINWKDDCAFEIDVTLPLRKAGIDSITCDGDEFVIHFMNETRLTINVPDNIDNLLKVIERDLLRWDDYGEGYRLQGHFIETIIDYLKVNIMEIKEAIEKTK